MRQFILHYTFWEINGDPIGPGHIMNCMLSYAHSNVPPRGYSNEMLTEAKSNVPQARLVDT